MTTMLAIALYSMLACNSYKRGLQHLLVLAVCAGLIGWGTLKSTAFKVTGAMNPCPAGMKSGKSFWSKV